MIPAERVRELAADLKRRAESADDLAAKEEASHLHLGAARCAGNASAYRHAAEMVEQLLKDEPPCGLCRGPRSLCRCNPLTDPVPPGDFAGPGTVPAGGER